MGDLNQGGEPTVALRTGETVKRGVLEDITRRLETIWQTNPFAFEDMIRKARDDSYEMEPSFRSYASRFGLMRESGEFDPDTRKVIVASSAGEMAIYLVDPITGNRK